MISVSLRRKPKTLEIWLNDVEWAKKEVQSKEMSPPEESVNQGCVEETSASRHFEELESTTEKMIQNDRSEGTDTHQEINTTMSSSRHIDNAVQVFDSGVESSETESHATGIKADVSSHDVDECIVPDSASSCSDEDADTAHVPAILKRLFNTSSSDDEDENLSPEDGLRTTHDKDSNYVLSSSDSEEDMDTTLSSSRHIDNEVQVLDPRPESTEDDSFAGKSTDICNHDDVDSNIIDIDPNHPGIFVRKKMTSQVSPTGRLKKTDRVWNNYHCCFICKKLSTNIVRHFLTHKENVDIQEFQLLKKCITKEDAKAKQTLLRNRGDHEHNMVVKKMGKGELIISRRSGKFHVQDYGPCPNCLEWMKRDSFSGRHQKLCPSRKSSRRLKKGEAIVRSAVVTGEVTNSNHRLVSEVYPIMTRDDVTALAKEDALIVALGNNWLMQNLGNKLKRKYYTSSRMRGAARLLQNLKSITKSNKAMKDYLTPGYFDAVCEAALLCAHMENDDEEDLKSPSSALKISHDINRMANIKLGLALRFANNEEKKDADEFLCLLKMEWATRVTRIALLKLREHQINQPNKQLPVPEDLSVLGGRVVAELKSMELKIDLATYRRTAMLLQTRLLTYNKRRSGELEALTLENFRVRSKGLDEADKALIGKELTDLERYLVESQELIKIRGKNGKIVPILVPEDSKRGLAYLAKAAVRQSVGIKSWNTYVFANTGDGVLRAYDSLKEICAELNLVAPERITSVTMRKYIATLSQVIDMKDHELDWLCNHLGHTAGIHKLHYRSTSGFIERVNIGKLMLLQDLNIAGKYAGQRLQDIDISELVTSQSEESVTVDAVTTTVGLIDGDNCGEDADEDADEDEVPLKKTKTTRKAWTEEEEREIELLLADNLRAKRIPKMKECLTAIAQSRMKNGNIHKRNWETIKQKTNRMINKKL